MSDSRGSSVRADLLIGRFERLDSVGACGAGEIVAAAGPSLDPSVLLLVSDERAADREVETLALVEGPGVPRCLRMLTGLATPALVLDLPTDVLPLSRIDDLPLASVRAGLIQVLSVLARAHGRAATHGAISRETVLVDPHGTFWLVGWSATPPAPERAVGWERLGSTGRDLRAVGRAFGAALLRRPWRGPDGDALRAREVGELDVDPDFRRVLVRLLVVDAREAYRSVSDVLTDLGEPDTPDPWERAAFVPLPGAFARIERALEDTGRAPSADVRHVAEVQVVGPSGSGRTRFLAELARRARGRRCMVLQADSSARGPWRGLSEIVRQLVQLEGAASRARRSGALASVMASHDSESSVGPLHATEALLELVRAVDVTAPTLILLDDVDDLPRGGREAWEAIGRLLHDDASLGRGRRLLLVGSRRSAGTSDGDPPRETVMLGPWSNNALSAFLGSVLDEPSSTRCLVARLSGALPGEIVAYLRDLVARGELVRVENALRVETALHRLPDWTPGATRLVPLARETCGRDVTDLCEVLAVAGRPGLSRELCEKLSELPGPRLWKAAERALALGLLRRDGATWSLRTHAIEQRVYQAIPTQRRHSLHHELLHHLLATAPHDRTTESCAPDLVAYHARCAQHAQATEWTEAAIARLTAEHRYDDALDHLEHALETLGPPHWSTNRTLQRADLLHQAGRLAEALDHLATIGASRGAAEDGPAPVVCGCGERCARSPCPGADVQLRSSRIYHQLGDDDAVLSLPVPRCTQSPRLLRSLRLLRSMSFARQGHVGLAVRERRLAGAEWPESGTPPRPGHDEAVAERWLAFARGDYSALRRHVIASLRSWPRSHPPSSFVDELVTLANAVRLQGDVRLAARITRHADRLLASLPSSSRHTAYRLGIAAILASRDGRSRSDARARAVLTTAHSTGDSATAVNARLYRIQYGIHGGELADRDRSFLEEFLARLDKATPQLLRHNARVVIPICGAVGHFEVLRRLAPRLATMSDASPIARSTFPRLAAQLLMVAGPDLVNDLDTESESEAILSLLSAAYRSAESDHATSLLASDSIRSRGMCAAAGALIRCGLRSGQVWPRAWTESELRAAMVRFRAEPEGQSLALALRLWDPKPRAGLVTSAEAALLHAPDYPAVCLMWQYTLCDALRARDAANLSRQNRLSARMLQEIDLLDDARGGVIGRAFAVSARSLVTRYFPRATTARPAALPPDRVVTCDGSPSAGVPEVLAHAVVKVERALRERCRVLAVIQDRRFAELIVNHFTPGTRAGWPRVGVQGQTLVVFGLDVLREGELIAAAAALAAPPASRAWSRALVVCHSAVDVLALERPAVPRILTLSEWSSVRLELEADYGTELAGLVGWLRDRLGCRVSVPDQVLAALGATLWPMPLEHAEEVIRALSRMASQPRQLDWLAHLSSSSIAVETGRGEEADLLRVLRAGDGLSARDCATEVGEPLRTVQRRLARLIERGIVLRVGQARASRYWVASRAAGGEGWTL